MTARRRSSARPPPAAAIADSACEIVEIPEAVIAGHRMALILAFASLTIRLIRDGLALSILMS